MWSMVFVVKSVKFSIMHLRYIIFSFALLLLASLPCRAADSAGGQGAFVLDLAHNALLSMPDETVSSGDRQRRFEGFFDKDFDLPQIATFVLGRYWRKASDLERQAFTAAFRDYMVRVYSWRFTKYDGSSFRVVGQQADDGADTLVSTEINQPSGPPIRIEWRVAGAENYKIIDVSVAGVSMALVQREDFVTFLKQNGGDLSALTRTLATKVIQ